MSQPVLGSLFTDHGEQLPIDPIMLAKGGEGAVYRVRSTGSSPLLAKIYSDYPSEDRVAKLKAMVASSSPSLGEAAAWPLGLLCDHMIRGEQRVVGFVMPEVLDHRELHQLFSPAERKRYFPLANWKMLALAGSNLARVVSAVHHAGAVVGDLNQNNVLVSSKATVKLIDCDSFQFRRSDGKFWTSDVGKEEYLPPELQSATLRGLVRTPNHDSFALAILIFQLLFMGRHPFTGRHQKRGDFSIGEAISQGFYFYGRTAASKNLSPPPGVITPACISPILAEMFEQAYLASERPTAREWSEQLLQFANQLAVCQESQRHLFLDSGNGCPWCQLKKTMRVDFFPEPSTQTDQAKGPADDLRILVDLDRIRQTIDQIPVFRMKYERPKIPKGSLRKPLKPPATLVQPGPVEQLTEPAEPQYQTHLLAVLLRTSLIPFVVLSLFVGYSQRFWGGLGLGISLLLLVISSGFSNWEFRKRKRAWILEFEEVRSANEELKNAWNETNREWIEELEARQKSRDVILGRLVDREQQWSAWLKQIETSDTTLRAEAVSLLDSLRTDLEMYEKELDVQRRSRQTLAIENWLESHLIRDAAIPQIGPARVATLASFGIETAADVVRLVQNPGYSIPGFGPRLMNGLWYWAAEVQGKFQNDPNMALPREIGLKIRSRYESKVTSKVERLNQITEDLRGFMSLVLSKKLKVELFLQTTTKEYLEAEQDVLLMLRITRVDSIESQKSPDRT